MLKEASENRMFIHHADILKADVGQIWSKAGLQRVSWDNEVPKMYIIGNLPFNIASPLIIKFVCFYN